MESINISTNDENVGYPSPGPSDKQIAQKDYVVIEPNLDMQKITPLFILSQFPGNPKYLGHCYAFGYFNHNPIFVIGPDCIFIKIYANRAFLYLDEYFINHYVFWILVFNSIKF